MEVYSTENEQVDAIKQFLKNYGLTIILAIVIGVGGIIGNHIKPTVYKKVRVNLQQ